MGFSLPNHSKSSRGPICPPLHLFTLHSDTSPWKKLWKVKDIAPKICMFMWRLINKVFPLPQTLTAEYYSGQGGKHSYDAHCWKVEFNAVWGVPEELLEFFSISELPILHSPEDKMVQSGSRMIFSLGVVLQQSRVSLPQLGWYKKSEIHAFIC